MSNRPEPVPAPKARSARGKRFLRSRAPKPVEDAKSVLFVRGTRTSPVVNDALAELCALKKPWGVLHTRGLEAHPFEDAGPVEAAANRADAALFVLGSSTKKRPDTLVIGRIHDRAVLDMAEVRISALRRVSDFAGLPPGVGLKPALAFVGAAWDDDARLGTLRSLLLDALRGQAVAEADLRHMETYVAATAEVSPGGEARVYLRPYRVALSARAGAAPASMEPAGPALDLLLGRVQHASADVLRGALAVPRDVRPGRRVKNVSRSGLGETLGRVHVGDQRLQTIQTRKVKALRAGPKKSLRAIDA